MSNRLNLVMVHAVVHNPAVVTLVALLIRASIGLFPHSGQGDPPMYGDYEAQRHWMEITTALPMGEWYFNTTNNNLQYWGLDYPPLTAYVSWICGLVASIFQPGLVELHASRGHDTESSRAFMRVTVLVCDALIFFPAVWLACMHLYVSDDAGNPRLRFASGLKLYQRDAVPLSSRRQSSTSKLAQVQANSVMAHDKAKKAAFVFATEVVLLVLLQPSIMLIDHGHFQYNIVSLGLSIWAMLFLFQGNHVIGSIWFSLALNFKQITLYYSPAVFFFLLSQCFHPTPGASMRRSKQPGVIGVLWNIAKLGVAVLSTFALMWTPLCLAGTPDGPGYECEDGVCQMHWEQCRGGLGQVVHRIFPTNRGLFEDKVANVWCAISPVVKLKQLLTEGQLVPFTALVTLVSFLPTAISLLRTRPGPRHLLWAMFNVSMSFFLFAYQVHEKSILFPLIPAALLVGEVPGPATWFSILATFSMSPLLFRDQLAIPYVTTLIMFTLASRLFFATELAMLPMPWRWRDEVGDTRMGVRMVNMKWFLVISGFGMILIHFCMAFVSPPAHLPDLWVVVCSTYSCSHFILALLYGNWVQWNLPDEEVGINTSASSGRLKVE